VTDKKAVDEIFCKTIASFNKISVIIFVLYY